MHVLVSICVYVPYDEQLSVVTLMLRHIVSANWMINHVCYNVYVAGYIIMDFSTVDIRSIRCQTDLSGLTPLG